MNKDQFVKFLEKSNDEFLTINNIKKKTNWSKAKVLKFLSNFHSFKKEIVQKFDIKEDFFDINKNIIKPSFRTIIKNKIVTKNIYLFNKQYKSPQRLLDFQIAKKLYNEDYVWNPSLVSSIGLKGCWANIGQELPFFSTDLNVAKNAITKLNNLFFQINIESICHTVIFECITYNNPDLDDQIIRSGKTIADAICLTLLDYIKSTTSNKNDKKIH